MHRSSVADADENVYNGFWRRCLFEAQSVACDGRHGSVGEGRAEIAAVTAAGDSLPDSTDSTDSGAVGKKGKKGKKGSKAPPSTSLSRSSSSGGGSGGAGGGLLALAASEARAQQAEALADQLREELERHVASLDERTPAPVSADSGIGHLANRSRRGQTSHQRVKGRWE